MLELHIAPLYTLMKEARTKFSQRVAQTSNLFPRVSHLTTPAVSEDRPWPPLVSCLPEFCENNAYFDSILAYIVTPGPDI